MPTRLNPASLHIPVPPCLPLLPFEISQYKMRQLLTQRFIDPIGEVLLQRQQLSALCRVQTLVIELCVLFLFRRGPGHVGAIEHSHWRGSPAATITGVLRRRESIGVRHPEAERTEKRPGGPHRPHFLLSSTRPDLIFPFSFRPSGVCRFPSDAPPISHRFLSTAKESRRRRAMRHVCRLREPENQNPLCLIVRLNVIMLPRFLLAIEQGRKRSRWSEYQESRPRFNQLRYNSATLTGYGFYLLALSNQLPGPFFKWYTLRCTWNL